MARRNTTNLCGILPIDKPRGPSSHDMINVIRRLSGEGRVGHAGTLDPMATGLLVVLVGPATRLARFLTAEAKTYSAEITFGSATDTDDADGRIISEMPVPSKAKEIAFAEASIADIIGQVDQLPPTYSAIKLGGTKAYTVARRGETPELTPRSVRIHDARLIAIEDGSQLIWEIEVKVSKGTYIRSIARDLGAKIGTAAHLSGIRRLCSGAVDVSEAVTTDLIGQQESPVSKYFIDPANALAFPVIEMAPAQAELLSNGCRLSVDSLPAPPVTDTPLTVVDPDRVIGIFASDGFHLKPLLVLPANAPLQRLS